jgi:ribonuclease HI
VLAKLDPIMHSGLRIATGAHRTTQTPSLFVDAGLKNLDFRRQKRMLDYCIKVWNTRGHPLRGFLKDENAYNVAVAGLHKLKSVPLFVLFRQMLCRLGMSPDATKVQARLLRTWTVENLVLNDSLSYMPKEYWTKAMLGKEITRFIGKSPGYAVFYTDGSRLDGRTASGSVRPSDGTNISRRLSDLCSVFTAEIVAVQRTIKHCAERGIRHVLVFTDSLSTVRCLKDRKPTNAIAIEIYRGLIDRPFLTVKLVWIPSHLGVKGNDMADALAKEATGYVTYHGLPLIHDLINYGKQKLNIEWQEWWYNINSSTGQTVKMRGLKNTADEWRVTRFKDRETAYKITRLRLGHTKFSHDHVFSREERRRCRCNEVLSVDHVLRLCILFEAARDKHDVSMATLNGDEKDLERLVSFFKEVELWQEI